MGGRALLLALVSFVVLLAVTLWVYRSRGPEKNEAFFTLAQSIPDTLTVVFRGDTTTVVSVGEAGWSMVSPVRYPADEVVVNGLLNHLTPLAAERTFPLSPEKLDTFGIRFPRGIIRAAYVDGAPPETVFVGTTTVGGNLDYVRVGQQDEVGLVPSRITRGHLLKETEDLWDTRTLPYHEARAIQVRFLNAAGKILAGLERDPDEAWRVTEPYPGPAGSSPTRDFLRALNHMHLTGIVSFRPPSYEPYGLDPPRMTVLVNTTEGEFGLGIGAGNPDHETLYVRMAGRDEVLEVSDRYLSVFARSMDRLREVAPVPFGLASVDSVSVRGVEGLPAVTRPPVGPFRSALGVWIQMRVESFEEASPARLATTGLLVPTRSFEWWGGGELLARMDLGRPRGDRLPIRVSAGRHAREAEILWVREDQGSYAWGRVVDTVSPGGAP